MDASRLQTAFQDLSAPAQIETLARFAFELTIVGRLAYEAGSLEIKHPRWLRRVNETQHRVAGQLMALLADNSNRYPDDVIVPLLLEENDAELRTQLVAAFARSLSAVTVNK